MVGGDLSSLDSSSGSDSTCGLASEFSSSASDNCLSSESSLTSGFLH